MVAVFLAQGNYLPPSASSHALSLLPVASREQLFLRVVRGALRNDRTAVTVSVLTVGVAAGQASSALSCWSSDFSTCGALPSTEATSSSVSFTFLLRKTDGTPCSGACAEGTTVTATLDGVAGTEVAGTCAQGQCTFSWGAPTTQQVGTLDVVATVQGSAVSATATFVAGELSCPRRLFKIWKRHRSKAAGGAGGRREARGAGGIRRGTELHLLA